MPWNNQSGGSGGGGGWKSGGGGGGGGGPWGQGPWGQGGGGGGGQQPDLEEILKRGQDKLKQVMPGTGGPPGWMWFLGLLGAIGVGIWYGFLFQVKPDELGIVMRFGQYVRQEPPGLHFRLPYPIEEVRLPKVTAANRTEIGKNASLNVRRGPGSQDQNEGQMLTGDENIIDVGFVVQWDIKDAAAFLFNIEKPEITVKEVAESVMREMVGKSKAQDVLTEKRTDIERQVKDLTQRVLDSYNSGIRVTQLQMQHAEAPSQVVDAFRDVAAAGNDKLRIQNQAETYANKVIPEARGEAQRILQEAQGYKEKAVAEARGEADRFLKIYEEYRKAPVLTRQRMHLETMERVLTGADKIIIDSKTSQSILPWMSLDPQQRRPPIPPAN